MAQLVSQPARRIAQQLRLRRGGIASRTAQLSVSFALSCLVHQFQMFNVTRRDMGEFVFFMSQPLAICAEELVRRTWQGQPGRGEVTVRERQRQLGVALGYLWVVLWFSFSLPIYVKGCRDAGIIRDAVFGTALFNFGSFLADATPAF